MILESICADYLERVGIMSKHEKKASESLEKLLEAYKAGKQTLDLRTEYDCLIGDIQNDNFLAGVKFGIQIIIDGMGGRENG